MGAGASIGSRPGSAAARQVFQDLDRIGLAQYSTPLMQLGLGGLQDVDDVKLQQVGILDEEARSKILAQISESGAKYKTNKRGSSDSTLREQPPTRAPPVLRRSLTELNGSDGGEEVGTPGSTRSVSSSGQRSARRSTRGRSNRVRKWRKGDLIATGAFGSVYQGLNEETGELLAVKQVQFSPGDEEQANSLKAEVEVMRKLHHPNIVRYLGAEADDQQCEVYIFQEWVAGGSISHMIKKYGPLSHGVVARYTEQVLTGLAYLHEKGVLHRDIKGRNILVSTEGIIKLADFGASKQNLGDASQRSMNQTLRGTPYFMAPEVINQTGHGRKADIWSVGGVVLEMLTGEAPWKSMKFRTPMALMLHISRTDQPPPLPDNLSEDLRDFLLRCFQRDPEQRPTAAELLQHPFILGDEGSSGSEGDEEGDMAESFVRREQFNSTLDNLAQCLTPQNSRPSTMASGPSGPSASPSSDALPGLPGARYERRPSGDRSRSNSMGSVSSTVGDGSETMRSRANSGSTPRTSDVVPIAVAAAVAATDALDSTLRQGEDGDEKVDNWPSWAKRQQEQAPVPVPVASTSASAASRPASGSASGSRPGSRSRSGSGSSAAAGGGNPFANPFAGKAGSRPASREARERERERENPFASPPRASRASGGSGSGSGSGNPFSRQSAPAPAALSAAGSEDSDASTPPARLSAPPMTLISPKESEIASTPLAAHAMRVKPEVVVRTASVEEASMSPGATWTCRDGHVNAGGDAYCGVCAAVRGATGRSPTDVLFRPTFQK